MPVRMSLAVVGIQESIFASANLIRELLDWSDLWDDIEDYMEKKEERVFVTEGASSGTRWQPLSKKYAAWKSRHWPGRRILVKTGALQSTLTSNFQGSIRITRRFSYTFGSSDEKLRWHEEGSSRLPARPMLTITPQDRAILRVKAQNFVNRAIIKSGFVL